MFAGTESQHTSVMTSSDQLSQKVAPWLSLLLALAWPFQPTVLFQCCFRLRFRPRSVGVLCLGEVAAVVPSDFALLLFFLDRPGPRLATQAPSPGPCQAVSWVRIVDEKIITFCIY